MLYIVRFKSRFRVDPKNKCLCLGRPYIIWPTFIHSVSSGNDNGPMFVYASLNFSAARIKHKALCQGRSMPYVHSGGGSGWFWGVIAGTKDGLTLKLNYGNTHTH